MKNRVDVTTPAGDTTLIGALTAVEGTTTVSVVAERGAIGVVATSPKSTRVTLERLVPVIVTTDPRKPLSGTNDVIVGRAIVGDGDGVGVGVMTGWNVGRVKVGTAIVGGTFSVKLGGGVSDGDGLTDALADAEGTAPPMSLLLSLPAVPPADPVGRIVPGANVPSASAEGVAVVALSFGRSQALKTSASASSAAIRPTTTRPK